MNAAAAAAPRAVVLHDRAVPASLRVSRALRLPLWGRDSAPLGAADRLVVVVTNGAQARAVLDAARTGTGRPPALVVGWGLAERHTAALLRQRVPVVDGTAVADPRAAHDALADGWDAARFADALALAQALADMEHHLHHGEDGP